MRRLGTLGVVVIPYLLLVGIGLIVRASPNYETLFKLDPTIRFWLAAILLAVPYWFGFNSFERLLSKLCPAPKQWWRTLMLSWLFVLATLGVINLFAAYTLSTDTWVILKLFGIYGLFWLFGLLLMFFHFQRGLAKNEQET